MRLEQLQYILEVERQRSFSKAAHKLYIAQSSLSSAILNLEKELGVKIFERSRSSREVVPTDAGLVVLGQATEIVEKVNQLVLGTGTDRLGGHLEFMAMPFICNGFIYEGLMKFCRTYQNLELIVHEKQSGDIVNELFHSQVGIGLISMIDMDCEKNIYTRIIESREFCFQPLFSSPICAFVRKDNPLYVKKTTDVASVHRYKIATFQTYSYHKVSSNYMMTNMRVKEFSDYIYTFDSMDNFIRILNQPDVVLILPQMFIGELERMGITYVRAIPLTDFQKPLEVGFLYCARYRCSAFAERFIRHMVKLSDEKIHTTVGYDASQSRRTL